MNRRQVPSAEISIRPERGDDPAAIADVVAQAFGRADEATLVDRLRADGDVLLSLVAVVDDAIVGHILFSALEIVTDDGTLAAAALAPMAVLPAWQHQGIGSALVRAGIAASRAGQVAAIVVLGHENYYPRFGFSPALARNLQAPFAGDAFMALELEPGTLGIGAGTVRYARAFGLPAPYTR